MKHLSIFLITLFIGHFSYAQNVDVMAHKGQVVYLDFWASWCGPCKESFPWLNKMSKKYPQLKIIAINLDKNKSEAEQFLKKYPANFEVVYDPSGKLAEKYKVKGMPYSLLFSKEGKEVHSHIGFADEKSSEYEQQVKKLLGEKP